MLTEPAPVAGAARATTMMIMMVVVVVVVVVVPPGLTSRPPSQLLVFLCFLFAAKVLIPFYKSSEHSSKLIQKNDWEITISMKTN